MSGDDHREALRHLLLDHRRLLDAFTKQSNHLRTLLLTDGDARDRTIARGRLGYAVVADLSNRAEPRNGTIGRVAWVREIRRIAAEVGDCRAALSANQDQLLTLVNELDPGLTAQHRVGPVRAAEIIVGND